MPVIMMSGHATIETAVEATKIGAQSFLEKPITMQKLLKAVEAGLARNSGAARGRAQRKPGMAGVVPMPPVTELTVEAAMTGGQTIPAAGGDGPAGAPDCSSWTSRCAMRATNSRSATSSSTSPRKAAR